MSVRLDCQICGGSFRVIPSRVAKGAKYCSYRCHQIGEGRKGGLARAKQVRAASEGKSYMKTNGKHTHRVMMEKILGRSLHENEIVHHKNGNKLDNAPENLEYLESQAEHIRQHLPEMLKRRKERHGY